MTRRDRANQPAESDADRSPSHAVTARMLVARARTGTLCTVAREPDGFPYGSLVAVAADEQGMPILLLSQMAEHRQNLDVRSEASVLVAEGHPEDEDPLAFARVTLLGRCAQVETGAPAVEARRSFLGIHPRAQAYVDFADFAFYRLAVQAIRYVGGFGQMSWVSVDEYRTAVLRHFVP
ncbi:MAG: pyridoxamine 5'-phosphate oxidase family protein [Polyangiaceae bacterium]